MDCADKRPKEVGEEIGTSFYNLFLEWRRQKCSVFVDKIVNHDEFSLKVGFANSIQL
jgi:hypothetical protein